MAAKLNLPPHAHAPMKIALAALFPPDEGLAKRYEESVSLVAGTNRLLGFRLRSQDVVGTLLQRLGTMAMQESAQAVAVFSKVEDHSIQQLAPHLELLIRELAWEHGWWTWWKTTKRLKHTFEIPAGFLDSLTGLIPQQPAPGKGSTIGRKPDSTPQEKTGHEKDVDAGKGIADQ